MMENLFALSVEMPKKFTKFLSMVATGVERFDADILLASLQKLFCIITASKMMEKA